MNKSQVYIGSVSAACASCIQSPSYAKRKFVNLLWERATLTPLGTSKSFAACCASPRTCLNAFRGAPGWSGSKVDACNGALTFARVHFTAHACSRSAGLLLLCQSRRPPQRSGSGKLALLSVALGPPFFSTDVQVRLWRLRGNIPHAVESTAVLTEVVTADRDGRSGPARLARSHGVHALHAAGHRMRSCSSCTPWHSFVWSTEWCVLRGAAKSSARSADAGRLQVDSAQRGVHAMSVAVLAERLGLPRTCSRLPLAAV